VHALQFLPFAILARISYNSSYPVMVTAGLLLAALTESVQYFLSWRAYNINDLLANMLGVFAGVLLVFIIGKTGVSQLRMSKNDE
jgi:VanZ family protein